MLTEKRALKLSAGPKWQPARGSRHGKCPNLSRAPAAGSCSRDGCVHELNKEVLRLVLARNDAVSMDSYEPFRIHVVVPVLRAAKAHRHGPLIRGISLALYEEPPHDSWRPLD